MQRRCCWPPERAPPGWVRRFAHLTPEPRPLERLLDEPVLVVATEARQLEAGQHVVADVHGREGVGLLEDHADPHADLLGPRARRVDVLAVEVDLTCQRGTRDQLVHAVEQPQEGGLAAARGPDQRRDLACGHVQVDAFQHEVVAEPSARVDRFERGGPRRGAAVEVHAVRLAGHVGGGGVVQVDRGVRHGKVLRTGGRAWRSGAVARVPRGRRSRPIQRARAKRESTIIISTRAPVAPRWMVIVDGLRMLR